MKLVRISEYEQLHICNINNGERFITYCIKGKRGELALNGACARLAQPGDRLIITTYETVGDQAVVAPAILIY
jgi:aspartate 1-decarboxylase